MPQMISSSQYIAFQFGGLDGNSAPADIVRTMAVVDDYTKAYVAIMPDHVSVAVVPKLAPPPGQSWQIGATMHATDLQGNPLPPLDVTAIVQGPPAPPNAVSLAVSVGPNPGNIGSGNPADPGTPSVNF